MSHCQPYIHLIHLTGLSLIYPLFPGASVSPAHKYICVSQTDPYKNKHKSRLMTSGFPPFKNFSAMPKRPPDTLAGFLTAKKSPAKQTCFVGLLPLPATPDTYCSAANLFTQPYAKKRAAACIQTAALVVA